MKKNVFTLLTWRFCLLLFFITILCSCIIEQKNIRKKTDLPLAFWNQQEFDKVMHIIDQPRTIFVNVTLLPLKDDSSLSPLRLFIGTEKYGSQIEFIDIPMTKNNRVSQHIQYNHSFVGIEITQSLIPKENGIQNIFYSWYRPGIWADELSVTIDTSQFFCIIYPALDSGIIQCDLLFPPDWEEKKVWVCFERNFALTSTPGEHPHELRAKEATIIREGKGKITIFLTMSDFFRRWNKTYTHPWKAGDIYPVELSLTLLPPEDFTEVTLSNKKDPPFIPNHYEGKVDAHMGDPYLFIPSVEPIEEIFIETTINIPLTDAMIDSL